MVGTAVTFEAEGLQLSGWLSRPDEGERAGGEGAAGEAGAGGGASGGEGGGTKRCGLVLCHGFPTEPKSARTSASTYPQLADRLAGDAGWIVLTFNFRGTGDSAGNFSLSGWMADLRAAIDFLLAQDEVGGVWVAGFSTGGALAMCVAGEDERVRGAASLGARADFHDWLADPPRFLEQTRQVGMIRDAGFPPDVEAWTRELREIRPLALVGKIPPRPVLIVHGGEDEVVPLVDARALADAAEGEVELRVVSGAGHALRHDPRAVAVLLGWLERQSL